MGSGKKSDRKGRKDGEAAAPPLVAAEPEEGIELGVLQRTFPGPRGVETPLRVAFERGAYAELVVHAKESLDAEIGGVLVGRVCEDDEGPFLHVGACIRGVEGKKASTHFTFTQETWTSIHKTLDEKYPDSQMVGWYHSHPGFGVEFSEMDLFIQRNFFKSPTQVAVLTDPLGGDMALCVETPSGVRYIERFFVGGREHKAKMPVAPGAPAVAASPHAAAPSSDAIRDLEVRVRQLLLAVDDQRAALHRFLMAMFMAASFSIVSFLCYGMYRLYTSTMEQPRVMTTVPVPIRVGDSNVIMGVAVTSWNVPAELNAVYVQLEKEKRAAAEELKKAREAEEAAAAAASAAPERRDGSPSASPVPEARVK